MGVDDVSRRRAEVIRRAANALIDLVGAEFPKPINRSAPAYRVAQHGLVAKATSLMEGIVDALETNRRSNLQILIRSLCDHATILAWISADPERNYPLWSSEDARGRVPILFERALDQERATDPAHRMIRQPDASVHPLASDHALADRRGAVARKLDHSAGRTRWAPGRDRCGAESGHDRWIQWALPPQPAISSGRIVASQFASRAAFSAARSKRSIASSLALLARLLLRRRISRLACTLVLGYVKVWPLRIASALR
jgi:hypothetical protein